MTVSQGLPTQTTPFLSPDGRVSPVWWRFLLSLFVRTGSGTGGTVGPIKTIALGASPFVYTAQSLGSLIISGAGVAKLEFSRDGVTFIDAGAHYGSFLMALSDSMRITYVAPSPSVTFAPMV